MFKPKDEEPYGRLNPKVRAFPYEPPSTLFTSRLDHQVAAQAVPVDHTLRTCLPDPQSKVRLRLLQHHRVLSNSHAPSYISEAAASLLDERLGLNIVPRTQLVSLSSQVRSQGLDEGSLY